MKIEGVETLRRRGTFRTNGVDLVIAPLPLGFQETLLREVPGPTPERFKQGENADGPIYITNEHTSAFKAQEMRANILQATAMVYMALREESRITWETQRDGKSAPDFYDAIRKEMDAFGWTDSDFNQLIAEVGKVSQLTDESIEQASQAFLAPKEGSTEPTGG